MRITKAGRKRKPRVSTLERDRIQILVTPGFKERFMNECVPPDSSMNAEIRRLMQNEVSRVRRIRKNEQEV